jgi:hypothetical protein
MSDTPSQFIVPRYEVTEGFDSASASASDNPSVSASEEPIVPEQTDSVSASEADIADLQAALESIPAEEKPAGAGVVDSIFGFFATFVELIKYIIRSISDGVGINEFQFGYIVLGLGALFMTLPLWGEPRLIQNPLPRNSRIPTTYTPVSNNKRNNAVSLQPQVE